MCGLMTAFLLVFAGCSKAESDSEKESNSSEKEIHRTMTNHAVYDGVDFPETLWETPTWYRDEENDRTESTIKGKIQAIYCRSDYKSEESYAFAFLGIPENAKEGKTPAVLLLHGGGGTAYWQWVQEWVNRGFIALALDLEGHVPKKIGTTDNAPADLYVVLEYLAPHNLNYGDANLEIRETWMYYAASTAIIGNSLLHSLPEVDKNMIGVCGISWGSVITCIICGYDDRFAFGIPIYGGLNNAEGSGNIAGYLKNHPKAKVWDDDEGLSRVETPMYFLAMNNDINFFPDNIMYTIQRCRNVRSSFVKDWGHSHSIAISRSEPYDFASGEAGMGNGLSKLSEIKSESGSLEVIVPDGVQIKKAYIMATDSDMRTLPTWQYERLEVNDGKISYSLSEKLKSYLEGEITYFYVYVEDNYGRVVSTNLHAI